MGKWRPPPGRWTVYQRTDGTWPEGVPADAERIPRGHRDWVTLTPAAERASLGWRWIKLCQRADMSWPAPPTRAGRPLACVYMNDPDWINVDDTRLPAPRDIPEQEAWAHA